MKLKPAVKTGKVITAPATGETLAEILEHDAEDLAAAVEAAKKVQPQWAASPYREKALLVRKAALWIQANADRIAETISLCTGKTRVDALATEVLPAALAAKGYVKIARGVLAPKRLERSSILFFNKRSRLYRVPFGVVGVITPWNYPFGIPVHEVFSALLSGNGVVLKVATQVQPVGGLIAEMIEASGFPENLFSLVHLPGRIAGKSFLDSGIGKLFFTGSEEVGRELMTEAGSRLIPVNLELGGNDAMLVLAGANLARAAACAAWAGISNCGQSCGGVQRIFVERPVYAEFTARLRGEIDALRQGPDTDMNIDFGALTTREQLEIVEKHIAEAEAAGAVPIAASMEVPDSASKLLRKAAVLEIDPAKPELETVSLLRAETFGPVMAVRPVESAEEGLRLANDSSLGLTASIWCGTGRGKILAPLFEAGAVTINDHLMSHGMAETPWGGFKRSGIGRSHGALGIEEMTQPLVVVEELLPFMNRAIWWYPHGPGVYAGLKGALNLFFAPGFSGKLKGLVPLAGLFMKRFFNRK